MHWFFRWYAQMLEQTEGILENSEASLKATIDNFAKKQRDAAHYAAEQGHVGVLRLLLQTSKYFKNYYYKFHLTYFC